MEKSVLFYYQAACKEEQAIPGTLLCLLRGEKETLTIHVFPFSPGMLKSKCGP